MFIIIEGPDAAGKSSLLEALERELTLRSPNSNIYLFHKGRPLEETRRWVLNEYALSIDELATSDAYIVADRWHWGEVTYAPLKRPHTNKDGYGLLGQAGWRWVELFLLSRGATTWVMSQPLWVLQERLQNRGDDFVSVDELEAIVERYDFGIEVAPSVVAKIAPDPERRGSLRTIAKAIVDRARHGARQTIELRERFPEYIGSPTPSVLLLGDRRNVTEQYGEETRLPFMPVAGNSGEFLLDALTEKFWQRVGIANANDNLSAEQLHELWKTLRRPPVIALGREAETAVISAGLADAMAGVLAHPQYVRRFHSSDRDEYGRVIEQLARGATVERSEPWILR